MTGKELAHRLQTLFRKRMTARDMQKYFVHRDRNGDFVHYSTSGIYDILRRDRQLPSSILENLFTKLNVSPEQFLDMRKNDISLVTYDISTMATMNEDIDGKLRLEMDRMRELMSEGKDYLNQLAWAVIALKMNKTFREFAGWPELMNENEEGLLKLLNNDR